MPVAAETYDGYLSDINGYHVKQEHVFSAIDSAVYGAPIEEGSIGGGTGMICYGYKGGSGTSSRVITYDGVAYTLGVFVQSNFGDRRELIIDNVPVGRHLNPDREPEREGDANADKQKRRKTRRKDPHKSRSERASQTTASLM